MSVKARMKRLFSVAVATFMLVGMLYIGNTSVVKAETMDDSKIVIVCTNDAHCNIDAKDNEDPGKAYIGYAGVAEVYKQKQKQYSNVALVDAGDHIQGSAIGILSKGQDIINIMNEVGYTVSTLGNHEFDYGLDRLFELTHPNSGNTQKAKYPYVCCNFVSLSNNETVYEPYIIKEYNYNGTKKKVAYVGIATPETIALSVSNTFRNADDELIYGFCQDDTGELLYSQIQKYVDAARNAGADYVIALGHVGQEGRPDKWRSDTIVKNTSGIDAFIDGHSHEKYIQNVENKDGKPIVIIQTGTQLNAVGLMTIDIASGDINAEVVNAPVGKDAAIEAYIADINAKFDKELDKTIAKTEFDLTVFKEGSNNWLVRESETNMADLVTDAFRNELGTDISIMVGGNVRNMFDKGDITFREALSVLPFGNEAAIIKASGQQIKDALEMGAMKYPDAFGAFMQVSGMSYEIADDIPSSVKLDSNGLFVSVEGEYRVRNVMIGNEPLDVNKMYTVAGVDYTLLASGDGLSMFKDCESLLTSGKKDIEVFAEYLEKIGIIGDDYSNLAGQGRIKIVKASEQQRNEQKQEDTPSTGDNTMLMLYVVAFLASGIIVIKCRKKA